MFQNKLFPKTKKVTPKDAESVNHKLLVRGGFIDQLMAGSWTLLPLGWRVVEKINQITREEMNATGAQELLMPLMHPKEIWNETGRWESASEVMYQFKDLRDKEFALSFTHEEVVMDLIRKHASSYQDFPIKVYHFSTKFRNELRPRSGILRGREFLMKDLYSAHTSKEDLMDYYEIVKKAYSKIFKRVGLDAIVTEASGGVFTEGNTHEFQVLAESGEDEIIYCPGGDFSQNVEIAKVKEGKQCDLGHGPLKRAKCIEVGNIFPLGTWYSERMGVYFTDSDGKKKPVWFGSYGIGITRLLGTLVEVYHDEKGIVWPKSVAPFDAHLVEINKNSKDIYQKLADAGLDILYDDRNLTAGEKFADCDLIGIPVRLVVSQESGDKIEWKSRDSDKTELLTVSNVIERLKK